MAIHIDSGLVQLETAKIAEIDKFQACIDVLVVDKKVVFRIPLYGNIVFNLPNNIPVPNGTVANACVEIKLPSCVLITVTVLGQSFEGSYGFCK